MHTHTHICSETGGCDTTCNLLIMKLYFKHLKAAICAGAVPATPSPAATTASTSNRNTHQGKHTQWTSSGASVFRMLQINKMAQSLQHNTDTHKSTHKQVADKFKKLMLLSAKGRHCANTSFEVGLISFTSAKCDEQ